MTNSQLSISQLREVLQITLEAQARTIADRIICEFKDKLEQEVTKEALRVVTTLVFEYVRPFDQDKIIINIGTKDDK